LNTKNVDLINTKACAKNLQARKTPQVAIIINELCDIDRIKKNHNTGRFAEKYFENVGKINYLEVIITSKIYKYDKIVSKLETKFHIHTK
jgi:hypothetical protein